MKTASKKIAYYHLPGLFEFYDFYNVFLPLFYQHREYFYDWCEIGSVYGAPEDCIWGGGRTGCGEYIPEKVFGLMQKYDISSRLTFSNSFLRKEHLDDKKCNTLCEIFSRCERANSGVIIYSDLLLDYLKKKYPDFYYVSSTTKVLTDKEGLINELNREDFRYVVPDFRFNKNFDILEGLSEEQKSKVEFLCNECCYIGCNDRKACYENVSLNNLGVSCPDHICKANGSGEGYKFSDAMKNPSFISVSDIKNIYLPMGFDNFKIEGRGLGSAIVLEFILYYMTKPEYALQVREAVYLDSMLDLF